VVEIKRQKSQIEAVYQKGLKSLRIQLYALVGQEEKMSSCQSEKEKVKKEENNV
jgi:hypothetical protein